MDPNTGEDLGRLSYVKSTVRVTEVYEKFSLAESFESVMRDILPFPSYMISREVTKKLPIDPLEAWAFKKDIKVGEEVVQVTKEPSPEKRNNFFLLILY